MYAHILASALDDWVDELTGDALFDYTLVCRSEMLKPGDYEGDVALTALAVEVAYDRALIKLREAHGIDAIDVNFLHPREERTRLEEALAAAGLDLVGLARRPRTD